MENANCRDAKRQTVDIQLKPLWDVRQYLLLFSKKSSRFIFKVQPSNVPFHQKSHDFFYRNYRKTIRDHFHDH